MKSEEDAYNRREKSHSKQILYSMIRALPHDREDNT